MLKKMKSRCLVARSAKNPRAFCRWAGMKWKDRVRAVEKQLGGTLDFCC